MSRHDKPLSQGYEPGFDPYDTMSTFRPIDFGIARPTFHADEALISVTLTDTAIRRALRVRLPPGPKAIAQASYSAHALESEREETALELLRDAENLAALGDIDENSGAGWGDWMRETRSLLSSMPPSGPRHVSAAGLCIPGCPACDADVKTRE